MVIETPARSEEVSKELEALMEEAQRRARRRRLGYASVVAIALLLLGVVLLVGRGGGENPTGASSSGLGAAANGSERLYLRASMIRGRDLISVDTATGQVERLAVPLGCGDTPFCLIPSGDQLIVGSVGRTHAYDPAGPHRVDLRRIGSGWIAIPSSIDGRVWLGILADGKLGGPYSRGLSAVREVDTAGRVIRSMKPPGGQWPVLAVDSGLLFQARDSVRLWSFEERDFSARSPGAFPADARGDLVATCGDPCRKFTVTDFETGAASRIKPPSGYSFVGGYEGQFSPDGSKLALPVVHSAESGPKSRRTVLVSIAELGDGRSTLVAGSELDPIYFSMAWADSGDALFFAGPRADVMRYELASGAISRLADLGLPSGGSIMQMVDLAYEQGAARAHRD